MNRRQFATTTLFGGLIAGAVPALAQNFDPRRGPGPGPGQGPGPGSMGPAERQHAMETLAVGSVALETSRLATSRARNPLVREFAELEVEEQTTVAQIIGEMTGRMPPPLQSPADRRMIERLAAGRGAMFDREYLAGQVDGHQRLLTIQDRYLSAGRDPHQRHIAMLARGRINEHLRDLARLGRLR